MDINLILPMKNGPPDLSGAENAALLGDASEFQRLLGESLRETVDSDIPMSEDVFGQIAVYLAALASPQTQTIELDPVVQEMIHETIDTEKLTALMESKPNFWQAMALPQQMEGVVDPKTDDREAVEQPEEEVQADSQITETSANAKVSPDAPDVQAAAPEIQKDTADQTATASESQRVMHKAPQETSLAPPADVPKEEDQPAQAVRQPVESVLPTKQAKTVGSASQVRRSGQGTEVVTAQTSDAAPPVVPEKAKATPLREQSKPAVTAASSASEPQDFDPVIVEMAVREADPQAREKVTTAYTIKVEAPDQVAPEQKVQSVKPTERVDTRRPESNARSIEVEPAPVDSHETGFDLEKMISASAETFTPATSDPVDPKDMVAQVSKAISTMVEEQKSTLRIQLKPEDLGSIDLKLSFGDDGVQINFRTDNPHTQSLLERHIGELRETLQRAGISLNQLSVGTQGQQQQHTHDAPFQKFGNRTFSPGHGGLPEGVPSEDVETAKTSSYDVDYRI